jgi:hypothetical protein
MATTDHSPTEDRETAVAISVPDLQRQLNESLTQLSPERLQVLADFADYLAHAESEAATQELVEILGLIDQVQQNHTTPETQYINWKAIRSDV